MSFASRSARVVAFVALSYSSLGASAPPSIADFAADADFALPALSPDGNKVAYITRADGKRVLVVLDLVNKTRTGLMAATVETFEISYCRFKNDERILCGFRGTAFQQGQPYPVSRLVAVDVSGGKKPRVLVQNGSQGTSQFQDEIMDWQIDDPEHVLIELSSDRDVFPAVHSLDVYTGLTSVVQRARFPILNWKTDKSGVVRFGSGLDEKAKKYYITRESKGDSWRTLGKWEIGESDFTVLGFGPAPATLLVSATHNGRDAIFEMDLTEKSDRQLLFANSEVDVDGPIYWPYDNRIVGFSYETDRVRRKFIDEEAKSIYDSLDAALPGADNYVMSSSRDGKKLLVRSEADVRPPNYHILDVTTSKMLRIGSQNAALAQSPLSPMKPVRIKAPDGVVLPGYLTLPLDSTGKKVPMVVYPHGGPASRDSWGYDRMVQFFASRGYAVLQVNFRGSVGFGDDWYQQGHQNWGTVMVDDITAATRWAIAEGIADPANTCIVGWSYGGYAALMSAVREPTLYRCAASIAGVADLRALSWQGSRFYAGRRTMKYILGDDVSELKAGSPMRAADKIQVPVLLVHGDDDWQATVDHSKRMAKALERAGKKFELVIIKDGNHSLTRPEWRETLLTKLEQFLAKNAPVK